ncbi:MAG: hypothetical protein KC619_34410, partial [Myxococcales bacterium]|nr:hypothetical protein [Myxococcales bacterium]
NTPLFSDYALKARAIYVPDGQSIAYDPDRPFDFPVGTAIVKTFYFPADFRRPDQDLTLIETRVLIHTEDGWSAWPYIWNEEQTDATLRVGGETRSISFVNAAGETETAGYLIPQRNQCRACHERNVGTGGTPATTPIGPAARHLNRDYDYGEGPVNQLTHLVDLGMLTGMPDLGSVPRAYAFAPVEAGGVSAIAPADLDFAARSYLDINCAHCHDPMGSNGITSQLFLNHDNPEMFNLGVCKRPGSAGAGTGGLTYDLVPGHPDESILVFRVETTEVGAMMPLLGRSLAHQRGAELVRAWVGAMEPVDCAMFMP